MNERERERERSHQYHCPVCLSIISEENLIIGIVNLFYEAKMAIIFTMTKLNILLRLLVCCLNLKI